MESRSTPSLKDFECKIHLGIMESPVSLICGHNICKACAERIMDRVSKTIVCPFDREKH